jgi:hypothetical protein
VQASQPKSRLLRDAGPEGVAEDFPAGSATFSISSDWLAKNDRLWRISDHRRDVGGPRLKVDLLGHIKSVIYLNPEIPNGTLQPCMTEEELHCAQIAGLAINLSHRVGTIKRHL